MNEQHYEEFVDLILTERSEKEQAALTTEFSKRFDEKELVQMLDRLKCEGAIK